MPGREKQIEQALRNSGIPVRNLEIKDHDGKVISIRGNVMSADQKTRVEQVAESIPGVKVANHLVVDQQIGSQAILGDARVYVVKKGDTLSRIAREMYGDASKWPRIHEANRAKIPNPDLIHPGDELVIPRGD